MKNTLVKLFILLLCSIFIITSCELMGESEPETTPTPVPTAAPTVTPTPVLTAPPTSTPVVTPQPDYYADLKGIWEISPTSPNGTVWQYIQFTDDMWMNLYAVNPDTSEIYMYGANEVLSVGAAKFSHEWGKDVTFEWEYNISENTLTRNRLNEDGTLEGTSEVYEKSAIAVPIGACFYIDGSDNPGLSGRYWVHPCSGNGYRVDLPQDVDITSIAPEIHVAPGYTISPATLVAQDLSSEVTYTITGNSQTKQVTLQAFQPTSDNLFVNGNFDLYDLGWWTYDNADTGITASLESGVMHLTFSQAGVDPWDNALGNNNLGCTIENGNVYRVSLDAWGSDREIRFVLQEDGRDLNDDDSDWSGYCFLYPQLTVAPQTFTYFFQMTNPTDNAPGVNVHMAQDAGDVYLDNMVLKEIDMTGSDFLGQWVESPADADTDVVEFYADGTVDFWDDYACMVLNGTGYWDVTDNTLYLYNGLDVQVYTLNIIDDDTCQLLQGGSVVMTQYRKGTEP